MPEPGWREAWAGQSALDAHPEQYLKFKTQVFLNDIEEND